MASRVRISPSSGIPNFNNRPPVSGALDFFAPQWENYQIPGELILYRARRHLLALIIDSWEPIAAAIVLVALVIVAGENALNGWIQGLLALCALGALGMSALRALDWAVTRIIVTNKRLLELGGFITTRENNLPNSKLTDLAFVQTVPGKIFGYGFIRVESAGQLQALNEIKYLRMPLAFLRQLGQVALN